MDQQQIELVVFDWAGTTVDYGSSAPSAVFGRVFSASGIHLTRAEINAPMGMEKKAHIRQLLSCASGKKQWAEKYGRPWNEADVERLYEEFEATLSKVVEEYSAPLPGVPETVAGLREMGLKIGSTTGYNARIMEQVIPKARALGYAADCVDTPDVTGKGRPSPFMLYECMRQMNVYPPCRVVKVGDTVVDMEEGKNAGAYAIGVLTGSNLLGLTQEEYDAMDPLALNRKKKEAALCYLHAGEDMVIDSIRELPEAIAVLNRRMAKGEAL